MGTVSQLVIELISAMRLSGISARIATSWSDRARTCFLATGSLASNLTSTGGNRLRTRQGLRVPVGFFLPFLDCFIDTIHVTPALLAIPPWGAKHYFSLTPRAVPNQYPIIQVFLQHRASPLVNLEGLHLQPRVFLSRFLCHDLLNLKTKTREVNEGIWANMERPDTTRYDPIRPDTTRYDPIRSYAFLRILTHSYTFLHILGSTRQY